MASVVTVRSRPWLVRARRQLFNLVLILIGIVVLIPFYWLFVNSVLPPGKAFSLPPTWIPREFSLGNYRQVFELVPFGTLILNSLKVAVIVTVGSLFVSIAAAYAFARIQFRGRNAIFLLFLAALMVPGPVTVAPTFILLRGLGLYDTHAAVFIPAWINVLAIFLLRQWFLTIPRELDDAAKMDGAGHIRILWHVILPLSIPPVSALTILVAERAWNSFFWPNIVLASPSKLTLPVGLVYLNGEDGSGSPGAIFAAISMVVIPVFIVFLIGQRTITNSIAMTGGVNQ